MLIENYENGDQIDFQVVLDRARDGNLRILDKYTDHTFVPSSDEIREDALMYAINAKSGCLFEQKVLGPTINPTHKRDLKRGLIKWTAAYTEEQQLGIGNP